MDRHLYRPTARITLNGTKLQRGKAENDTSTLYSLSVVDRAELFEHIATTLEEYSEVTLRELTEFRLMRHGFAEFITYLDLGSSRFDLVLLDFLRDTISWQRETAGHYNRAPGHHATHSVQGEVRMSSIAHVLMGGDRLEQFDLNLELLERISYWYRALKGSLNQAVAS